MALIAGLGEVLRDVAGIGRRLVVLQVTTHTGSAGEVVIVIDVTVGALPWRNRVHARECEANQIVVEARIRP